VFTAAVVEADPEADLPWLATAYVAAPTLNTMVRKCGPLPVPAVRWLAAGCAEALQSIHAAGLLHRDVKPSNVLVAPDGPRVIDFGVARAAERIQLTVTRGAAGTPAYMAPEQARDSMQASPASDVFSLGATLVFAATGRPPYRGETVMDVLVRLATEPPDLSGVPGELEPLVAACLERVPRDRPTDAAILGLLGSFAPAPAGASGGHVYLPDPAMAMIAEYQRNPQLTGRGGVGVAAEDTTDDGGASGDGTDGSVLPAIATDGTSGSHTALPGFDSVGAYRAGQEPSRPARQRRLAPPGGRPLAWAGWAVAAVALIAAGIALGMSLRGPASSNGAAGPPPAGPPSQCTVPVNSSTPQLCVNQPYGDPDTVFVVHGSGFAPGTPLTVRLVGVGVSPYHPLADGVGNFNYAIDQGHYFFSGPIRPGDYSVVVTAPDGARASASFLVNPVGPGGLGGPGGPPPTRL